MSFLLSFDASRYPEKIWAGKPFSEKEIEDEIRCKLEKLGIFADKYDVGNAQGRARGHNVKAPMPVGQCDLMGTGKRLSGRELCIEVKRPGYWIVKQDQPRLYKQERKAGVPTQEQIDFLKRKQSNGAICIIAWHWLDVEQCLKALGYL